MALIALLHPDIKIPSPEVRADMNRNAARLAPLQCCGATVFAGTGFVAAAVRSLISAMQLAARSRHPEKVFSSVDDAARWAAPLLVQSGMKLESPELLIDVARWVEALQRKPGP
jgi:hypothetical protein